MKQYKFQIPVIPKQWNDENSDEPDILPVSPTICKLVVEDFNSDELSKYSDLPYLKKLIAITGIELEEYNKVFIIAEVNKKLTVKNIKEILDFITGQCSDGWGECFEQQPQYLSRNVADVYISTWENGNECKYIGEIK